MAKKELEFAVKLSTEDFDASIASMQKKLNSIYSPQDQMRTQQATAQRMQSMGMGGILSGPASDAMKKATQQSRKELDSLIRDQAKAQRDLGMAIAQHAQGIEKLSKQQQEMLKGSKEELAIQQEIARTKNNSAKLTSEYKQKDSILNQLLDEKQRVVSEQQRSSPMGKFTEMARKVGPAGMISGAAGVLGAGVGIAAAGSDIYKYLGQAPISASAAAGRATQGTFGGEIQSAYSGRTPYDLAFMPERARAARMAQEATKRVGQTQFLDLGLKMAGAGLAGGAAGAYGGAQLGGMAGTFLGGPLGTAAGGAIGAGLGGIVGAGAGVLGAGLSNKSVALSPFSQAADKQRQAELAQTFADNFQKALEGEKLQNPLKKAAADEYYQNYMKNLESQRTLGLNSQTFHGPGGFRERAINAGFTDEMAMNAGAGIVGAGGSTRMGKESVFGLQAQRGLNLTNSNQVLGMLSGSLGGAGATKQATIDILAEGVKKGFGTEDFAEENRRFVQATAEAVVRSGAQGPEAIGNIAQKFGGFVSENTNKGIESGASAYQMANQQMSQTSGPGGAMRAAAFMRDADLGKLSPMDRTALMNIPTDQMDADHPIVQDIARRNGLDPKSLATKTVTANQSSLHRIGEADTITSKLQGLRKKLEQQGPVQGFQTMKEISAEEQHLQTISSVENPAYADRRLGASFAAGTSQIPGQRDQYGAAEEVSKKLSEKETGKEEDKTVAAVAESQRMVIENFREFKGDLVQTAEAVSAFNNKLKETVKIAMSLPEAQRMNIFQSLFPGQKPANQTQAGKQ